METKQEILREHVGAYLKASPQEKHEILDSLEWILKMHRKAIIRALKREQMRDRRRARKRPGPKIIYTKDVTAACKEVWKIAGMICAERLYPMVAIYVSILQRDSMWLHSTEATQKLLAMSKATLKRKIATFFYAKAAGGRSTTKPSNLKELIPIRRGPWKNPQPGYGEIDTVVHCGSSLLGDMAYTVNYIDIATTWTEMAAQMNKGQERTKKSIIRIQQQLPFRLLGLDPDTGSEFINWHLKTWCDAQTIELTRSRPNHKNDNAHIEQKNYTGVRKFLGYSRIETEAAIELMNQLYAGPLRLYINFFQPSMKCVEKIRSGSRYLRKYDTPQTPYQRALTHPLIEQSVKDELSRVYATLNPKTLKQEIDRLITKIFNAARRR